MKSFILLNLILASSAFAIDKVPPSPAEEDDAPSSEVRYYCYCDERRGVILKTEYASGEATESILSFEFGACREIISDTPECR